MTKEETTLIAAEAAGIIVGRIFKLLIILAGIAGLVIVAANGYAAANPAKPKVEQVEKAKPKAVKHRIKAQRKVKPIRQHQDKIIVTLKDDFQYFDVDNIIQPL